MLGYKTVLPVVLVALVPLIITPGLLFYFDVTPKLIALMMGAAIALPWVLFRPFPTGPIARRLYTLAALQTLSLAISTVRSANVGLSVFGSNWRSSGLLAQVVVLLFTLVTFAWLAGDRARIRTLLRAVTIAGSMAAIYGICQYFGWDPWQPAKSYHAGEGIWTIVRPPGTLGHADYFASYLLFPVFAGLALAAMEHGAWRGIGGCAAALGSSAIVLSGTRGALVGLAAGGVFLMLRTRLRLSRRRAAMAAGVVAAAAVFYLSPAGLALRSRVHWVSEDAAGGARLLLWRDSLRLAAEHPVLGFGPEIFPMEFPRVQSVELARAYPDFYYESPHNFFLDALVGQGTLGLGILIALIALGMWAGIEAGRRGAFLSAALVAMATASFFTVLIVPTAMCFYAIVAILVAMGCEPGVTRAEVSALGSPSAEMSLGAARTSACATIRVAAALPASAALIFLALRMLAADRSLELARLDLESGRTADAVAHYREARTRGLSAELWYARSLASAAAQEAIDAARRATAGESAQNAWYTLAWLYAREGDVPHTEESLRATLRASPNWFKPHWMLSQVLWREHREQEALVEAERAAWLNAGRNPEVARTADTLRAAIAPVPGR